MRNRLEHAEASIHCALATAAEDEEVQNFENAESVHDEQHDEPARAAVGACTVEGQALPQERPNHER